MSKALPRQTAQLSNVAHCASFVLLNGDLSVDENGWTIIPYGMWRHSQGWQRFGKEQATSICNAFASVVGRIKRALTGLPVFKGHPDDPAFEDQFPDKTEYGQVAKMEVRDNGLAIQQVLSTAGADLVQKDGLKFISPRWDAERVGDRNGVPMWLPTKMISVGLVKRPNIPNQSLANHATLSNASLDEDFMNKKDLIALFGLAADASDDAVSTALSNAAKRPTVEALSNAETAKTAAERAKALADTELATTKISLSNVTAERDTATTALSNERKAHRATLVNSAISDGRIKAADEKLWTARLEGNFDAEAKALSNLKPTIKVHGTTEQDALVSLAEVNAKLQSMTPEQRAEWSKTGIMANEDVMGAPGDDMSNVRVIANLVADEMKSPKYDKCKSNSQKHSMAFAAVMKAHPEFLKPVAAREES
jgi:hypothetical protein